jgi:hypothetical protein
MNSFSRAIRPLSQGRALLIMLLLVVSSSCALALWLAARELTTRTLSVATPICGVWQATTGPGLGGYASEFLAVAALSSADVWAVGARAQTLPRIPLPGGHDLIVPIGPGPPLISHWDGMRWQGFTAPGVGTLNALAAVTSNDIWAVGAAGSGDRRQIYITHWDGAHWANVGTPVSAGAEGELQSVVAVASDNVWAAGYSLTASGGSEPLMLHWDGQRWDVDPNVTTVSKGRTGGVLLGMAAISPSDIWAVGSERDAGGANQPLALHWTGSAWHETSMSPGAADGGLTAVAGIGADDVWAVGSAREGSLAMHWNGSGWSIVPIPQVSTVSRLAAVDAVTSADVWAVGGDVIGRGAAVIHWNGESWKQEPTLDIVPNQLYYGVDHGSANEIWAVGGTLDGTEQGPWYATVARLVTARCPGR